MVEVAEVEAEEEAAAEAKTSVAAEGSKTGVHLTTSKKSPSGSYEPSYRRASIATAVTDVPATPNIDAAASGLSDGIRQRGKSTQSTIAHWMVSRGS